MAKRVKTIGFKKQQQDDSIEKKNLEKQESLFDLRPILKNSNHRLEKEYEEKRRREGSMNFKHSRTINSLKKVKFHTKKSIYSYHPQGRIKRRKKRKPTKAPKKQRGGRAAR